MATTCLLPRSYFFQTIHEIPENSTQVFFLCFGVLFLNSVNTRPKGLFTSNFLARIRFYFRYEMYSYCRQNNTEQGCLSALCRAIFKVEVVIVVNA